MQSHVTKWGNSLGIRIPRTLAQKAYGEQNEIAGFYVYMPRRTVFKGGLFSEEEKVVNSFWCRYINRSPSYSIVCCQPYQAHC